MFMKRNKNLIVKVYIPTPTLQHGLEIGQLLIDFQSLSPQAGLINTELSTEVQLRIGPGAHSKRIAYQSS